MSRYDYDPREDSPERQSGRPYLEYPRVSPEDGHGRDLPHDAGERQIHHHRDRHFRLNQAEIEVIRDVGRFRIINTEDLGHFIYNDRHDLAKRDLRHLEDQKLIRFISLPGRDHIRYATLTKAGKELLGAKFSQRPGQEIYSGLKKLREAEHDAAVYKIYRAEVRRMAEHGCRPVRIRLDYEMKRNVQRELARARQKHGRDLPSVRQEIAERYHLAVVDNTIQFPDVRIEYEGPDRDVGGGSVDLEYVSDHYKPGQIAAKRSAGFVLYGSSDGRGRKPYGPDLVVEILR